MSKYCILSIDGGGIRGVYSAQILANIQKAVPGFLESVKLIAGTSTGGIIALGLAAGFSPNDLVQLYSQHCKEIFDDSWWDNIKDLGGLTGADYDNKNFQKILANTFGEKKLSDLSKRVLIPSFDLDNSDDPYKLPSEPRKWKAKFFHNYPGEDSDGDERVIDVALRTSAAPTYFPTYDGYIDGGVVANNPSVSAIAQALDAQTGNQKLSDLRLLSIGAGENPTYIAGKTHDWGVAEWARPLINLMIDGAMGVCDYECQRILCDNYRRVSTILPSPIKLDDVSRIPDLIAAANQIDLTNVISWVKA